MTTRIQLLQALFSSTVFVGIAIADPTPSPTISPAPLHEDYFVPKGGYIRTVREEQLRSQAATHRLIQGAPPIGGLKGNRALPVICVSFKNVPPPFPVSDYEKLLFGGGEESKTLAQYYSDMSNGKLHLTGKVVGWYELPKDDTFYENGQQGDGTPFGELLQFALEKADAEIDFGQFDNDGPDGVPNSGDGDDGKVDTLVIIHSDCGGECSDASSPHIRSHSAHYSDPQFGHLEKPFVTRSIRRGRDGKPKLDSDGKPEHIVIDDFIIVPAVVCPEPGEPPRITQIGVLCHEYGHALGLPDLYDRNLRSTGAGDWCLMAYGCYGWNHQHMDTPASMSAWCKQYLGWANVQTVAGSGGIQLEPVEDRNIVYRFNVANTGNQKYFLIEYRNNTWKDLGGSRVNWDCFFPGSGLAIWHVDERVGKQILTPSPIPNPNWPFAPPDQGQNDAPTLPNGGNTAYRKDHSLVALVEADGKLNLAKGRNFGAKGDLWATGDKFEDDPNFVHGSRAYDGSPTGIALTAIDLAGYTAFAQNLPIQSAAIANSSNPQPSPAESVEEMGTTDVESRPETSSPSAPLGRGAAGRVAAPPIPTAKDRTVSNSEAKTTPTQSNSPPLVDRLRESTSVEPARAESLRNLNETLSASSVKLNDVPRDADNKSLAANLNQQLEKQGLNQISSNELAKIAKAQPAEIRQEIQPDNRTLVQALATESRTKEVAPSAKPATPAESDIVKLIQDSKQKESVRIQSTPEGTRIERVTGLSVPVKTSDLVADAEVRVKQGLRKAIGEGIKLQPKENSISESAKGSVVRFEQVVRSDGKSLPIFETDASFYYAKAPKPTFTAVTNKTIIANSVKFTGVAGKLSVKDTQAIVAKELQVDAQQLGDGSEGVYLVGDNPNHGRIAIMVPIHVGENHDDIRVYVDSDTKEILEIK